MRLTADLITAAWSILVPPAFPDDYGNWGPSEEEDIRSALEGKHYIDALPIIAGTTSYRLLIFMPDEVCAYYIASYLLLSIDSELPDKTRISYLLEIAYHCFGRVIREVPWDDLLTGLIVYSHLRELILINGSDLWVDDEVRAIPKLWLEHILKSHPG